MCCLLITILQYNAQAVGDVYILLYVRPVGDNDVILSCSLLAGGREKKEVSVLDFGPKWPVYSHFGAKTSAR